MRPIQRGKQTKSRDGVASAAGAGARNGDHAHAAELIRQKRIAHKQRRPGELLSAAKPFRDPHIVEIKRQPRPIGAGERRCLRVGPTPQVPTVEIETGQRRSHHDHAFRLKRERPEAIGHHFERCLDHRLELPPLHPIVVNRRAERDLLNGELSAFRRRTDRECERDLGHQTIICISRRT
jgi:hypothetical protein